LIARVHPHRSDGLSLFHASPHESSGEGCSRPHCDIAASSLSFFISFFHICGQAFELFLHRFPHNHVFPSTNTFSPLIKVGGVGFPVLFFDAPPTGITFPPQSPPSLVLHLPWCLLPSHQFDSVLDSAGSFVLCRPVPSPSTERGNNTVRGSLVLSFFWTSGPACGNHGGKTGPMDRLDRNGWNEGVSDLHAVVKSSLEILFHRF